MRASVRVSVNSLVEELGLRVRFIVKRLIVRVKS